MELASNDGYLLQYFVQRGVPVLGIEPAANVAPAARERGVRDGRRVLRRARRRRRSRREGRQADLLLGNNVLGARARPATTSSPAWRSLLKPSGHRHDGVPAPAAARSTRTSSTRSTTSTSRYFSLRRAREGVRAPRPARCSTSSELATHGGSLRIYAQRDPAIARPVSVGCVELRWRERARASD